MRVHILASLLLAITLGAGTASGQTLNAQSAQPIDIYANFVGTWAGQNTYLKGGTTHHKSIRLVITETAAHDAMVWDYTYNDGTKPDDHYTKRITLNPAKEKMTLRYNHNLTDHYETTGLSVFALTGFGSFTAVSQVYQHAVFNNYLMNSQIVLTYLFRVQKDTLYYEWREGTKGTPLKLGGIFSFTRESAQPSQTHAH